MNNNNDGRSHGIVINSRNEFIASGIREVVSFDDTYVIMNTELGTLTIAGECLKIEELDTDSGKVILIGKLNELVYTDDAENRKGSFFKRLIK